MPSRTTKGLVKERRGDQHRCRHKGYGHSVCKKEKRLIRSQAGALRVVVLWVRTERVYRKRKLRVLNRQDQAFSPRRRDFAQGGEAGSLYEHLFVGNTVSQTECALLIVVQRG